MQKVLSFIIKHKIKTIIGFIVIIAIAVLMAVFSNGKNNNSDQQSIFASKDVKIVNVAESNILKQTIRYPGLVVSDQEVKIISKGSGNISNLNFKVGDKVPSDFVLAKIDSLDENPAKANYTNVLTAINNAILSKENISNTYAQSYKSAQIAYDTSRIATEQARVALENRKAISGQSGSDVSINADATADSVAATCVSIIDGINNITGLNDNKVVVVPYSYNLGALNQQSLINAKNSFAIALSKSDEYKKKTFTNAVDKIDALYTLSKSVQKLVGDTQILFQNTITSSSLPPISVTGSSLSSLQSAVVSYQSQISGAVSQINAAKQGITNTGLNNDATLDGLEKAYELAKEQENAAAQNLNNILASSKSQIDGAQSQIDSLSGQASLARIQLDNLTIKAPIAGTITQKMISAGDTVSVGSIVAVMSQTAKLKVQTYVDQIYVNSLQVGMPAVIADNNGNTFTGKVISVSPSADITTKRFLVEADFEDETVANLPNPGIIVSISFDVIRSVNKLGSIFLPITAVNVGQSESYIYLYDNGKAKKQVIDIISVDGENAEIFISSTLPLDAKIITQGNRLIQDGDPVNIAITN